MMYSGMGGGLSGYGQQGSVPGMMPQGTTVGNSQQPNYSNLTSSGYGVNNVSGVTNNSTTGYGMPSGGGF
jgi:hypothetical protein